MNPDTPEDVDRPTPPAPAPGWSTAQPPPYRAEPGSVPATQPAGQQPAGQPPAGSPPSPPGWTAGPGWTPPPAAPQPGVVPLRPLGVAEIITGAVDYVRRYPKAVIGISAIVGLGAAFGQLAVLATGYGELEALNNPETVTPEQLLELARNLIVVAVVQATVIGLLQVLGTGMLAHVMNRAVIGQPTTFDQAWSLVRPQILRLVGASLLVGVVVIAAVAVPLAPGALALFAGAGELGAGLMGLGGLVAVGLAIWLSFRLVLTTPAVALENTGLVAGLRRSWQLVGGAFWRTLGIVLLGVVLGQAVGTIAAAPFNLFAGATAELSTGSVFALALSGMVTMLVALPFIAGVTTLVYLDRRMRAEHYEVQMQQAALDAAGPEA